MSSTARQGARYLRESGVGPWKVRDASLGDCDAIAAGVGALLEEIGGVRPERPQMVEVARTIVADPNLGCILVGESGATVVGVLAASWQIAMHTGGYYGLIQDLWVAPAWRDGRLGSALLDAVFEKGQERGVGRFEVGLPSHRFRGLVRTETFYVRYGFAPMGVRMRKTVR